jgi:hypothetical protein
MRTMKGRWGRLTLLGLALALGLLGLRAPAALAGGVVVTLDQAPAEVVAGQPFEVAFTLTSMHGTGPVNDALPAVTFTDAARGERITQRAERAEAAGQYRAEVTLPAGGEWRWSVAPFGAGADYPASEMTPLMAKAAADAVAEQAEPPPAAAVPQSAPVVAPAEPADGAVGTPVGLLGALLGAATVLGVLTVFARRRGETP